MKIPSNYKEIIVGVKMHFKKSKVVIEFFLFMSPHLGVHDNGIANLTTWLHYCDPYHDGVSSGCYWVSDGNKVVTGGPVASWSDGRGRDQGWG